MRPIKSKPYRRCYGYKIRVPPRADGKACVVEVNPAAQTVTISPGAGEELGVTQTPFEKLIALAEQIAQEGAPILYRLWRHVDHWELVELYRAPSAGWHAPKKTRTVF